MSSQVQQQTPICFVSTSFDTLFLLTDNPILFYSVDNTKVSVLQNVPPSQNTNSPVYQDFINNNSIQNNNTNPRVESLVTVSS